MCFFFCEDSKPFVRICCFLLSVCAFICFALQCFVSTSYKRLYEQSGGSMFILAYRCRSITFEPRCQLHLFYILLLLFVQMYLLIIASHSYFPCQLRADVATSKAAAPCSTCGTDATTSRSKSTMPSSSVTNFAPKTPKPRHRLRGRSRRRRRRYLSRRQRFCPRKRALSPRRIRQMGKSRRNLHSRARIRARIRRLSKSHGKCCGCTSPRPRLPYPTGLYLASDGPR